MAEDGLGETYINAVNAVVSKIEKHPAIGKTRRTNIRSIPILIFTYDIVYEIKNDEIMIHAIAPQSRLPDYWIDRISFGDEDKTE